MKQVVVAGIHGEAVLNALEGGVVVVERRLCIGQHVPDLGVVGVAVEQLFGHMDGLGAVLQIQKNLQIELLGGRVVGVHHEDAARLLTGLLCMAAVEDLLRTQIKQLGIVGMHAQTFSQHGVGLTVAMVVDVVFGNVGQIVAVHVDAASAPACCLILLEQFAEIL